MWFSKSLKPSPKKQKPLILLVDDEIQNIALLRSNFENEGYRVEFATDGVSGGKMALDLQPDLIVSDVFMPGVDGLSMIEGIKEQPTPMVKVPVIFLSGRAVENFLPKSKDPEVKFALLKKPVFLPELNDLVRKFLS